MEPLGGRNCRPQVMNDQSDGEREKGFTQYHIPKSILQLVLFVVWQLEATHGTIVFSPRRSSWITTKMMPETDIW